jgi:hypothetical protein
MNQTEHIFIVGMDRTGTTLTRNILNCSDTIGMAGEAQYFRRRPHSSVFPDRGHRGLFKKVGDISTDKGAKRIVDRLFRDLNAFSGFWHFSSSGFDREDFLSKLLKTEHRERALLDLALKFHARGKSIPGEKTPANIFFVPTILEWFPNAKIIHMFRDPRAIYASRKNKKEKRTLPRLNRIMQRTGLVFEFYASNRVIIDWLQSIQFHRQYQEKYSRKYYLSKYEDLVCNPEFALHRLCSFLRIDLSEAMLQPPVVNSSFVPRGSSWVGFDTSTTDRWRKHTHPLISQWMTWRCKKQLLEYGYEL